MMRSPVPDQAVDICLITTTFAQLVVSTTLHLLYQLHISKAESHRDNRRNEYVYYDVTF